MENIKINTEYITLGQILKMKEIITSGGMAKEYLLENEVLVESVPENRRGRKIYPGMVVEIAKIRYLVE